MGSLLAPCLLVVLPGVALAATGEAKAPPRMDDMLEVQSLTAAIHLDIRYATPDNFMGRPVYPEARAFLRRPVAEALVRAHARLHAEGFGLLIKDAYRPLSVTRLFWDALPPSRRRFVADPAQGSSRGNLGDGSSDGGG